MKKIDSINSYNIAHIILLSIVVVVGIWFIIWAIVSMSRADAKTIEVEKSDESCVQTVIDNVAVLWMEKPNEIPQKYLDMVDKIAGRIVEVKTRGNCNGTSFVCEMGAIRSECDPCAVILARQEVINQHTIDLIQERCNIALN